MALAVALAVATLFSEDAACLAAGLLVARGEISAAAAVAGCGLGIWVGDIGLWALGRVGRLAVLRSRWLEGRVSPARARTATDWVNRQAVPALLVSRFLPGMRLPTYVAAGVAGVPLARFAWWTAVAVAAWTPLLVFGSMQFTTLGAAWLSSITGWGAQAGVVAACGALIAIRVLTTGHRRRALSARLARWRRWEFWPMWLFYPPVAAWIGWLALRHGGLGTMTASNPAIPDGGTVGESKAAILAALPPEWTIPHVLVPPGDVGERAGLVAAAMAVNQWSYPIIIKPDVGQRGAGVQLIADVAAVRGYLARTDAPVIVQPYHPGPFEAGVFYYRYPGWRTGRILSITDKEFPAVTGDGVSTLSDLIWRHPRYRMQAPLFLARHRERESDVVPAGETVTLAIAGNHAQGTLFRDGCHLITPALEQRIDEIARSCPGFFVGRFDVRYRDVQAFKEGRDLAIVELNGATAESTNIYDPGTSLLSAYRTLFRQWTIVFEIGAENRRRGARATSMARLTRLVAAHLAASN